VTPREPDPVNSQTAALVTPLREPDDQGVLPPDMTGLEVGLLQSLAEAYLIARPGPMSICLHDTLAWAVAYRNWRLDFGYTLVPPAAPDDPFEAWLIERWLREIRSEAFRSSAQFERLMAEWERSA
jgi:hypothetical protein